MGIIAIEGMEFYSGHGYFEEESNLSTRFTVDVYVEHEIDRAGEKDNLGDTVDYQQVFEISREVLQQRVKLLETLARRIARNIRQKYPDSGGIRVRVSKWHPPVGGPVDRSYVEYELE